MKKLFLLALFFLPLGIAAQEMKIAVVKANEVLMLMPEVSKLESEMATMRQQYEEELKTMQDEYNRKYADLVAKGDTLSDNIKGLRLQEIQDIQTRMENFVPMAQDAMGKKQAELLAPIQEKVNKAIQQVGQENGYTYIYIYDPQIVLYMGGNAIDATDKVKAKLGLK